MAAYGPGSANKIILAACLQVACGKQDLSLITARTHSRPTQPHRAFERCLNGSTAWLASCCLLLHDHRDAAPKFVSLLLQQSELWSTLYANS